MMVNDNIRMINILMVNDDGCYMVNDGYYITWLVLDLKTPLKNDGVKVSWDYDIPNMMGKIKDVPVTTNQKSQFSI